MRNKILNNIWYCFSFQMLAVELSFLLLIHCQYTTSKKTSADSTLIRLDFIDKRSADSLRRTLQYFHRSELNKFQSMCFLLNGMEERNKLGYLKKINASFLIQEVELAHKMSSPLLKKGLISINSFKNYVLPY